MEPRLSYSLEYEQIDGSLTFDTDDYIVEAKWRQGLDFLYVLDGRLTLDELLRRKKRHANETGSCYFPATMFSGEQPKQPVAVKPESTEGLAPKLRLRN
ncbi:hypothetical protein [Streptomyces wuyuanensis]|uniref:hypothetical protein n=1 Tax=Streptomyces wuyuanensis TaxID=1196353 RepID=UPI003D71384F